MDHSTCSSVIVIHLIEMKTPCLLPSQRSLVVAVSVEGVGVVSVVDVGVVSVVGVGVLSVVGVDVVSVVFSVVCVVSVVGVGVVMLLM